MPDIPIIPTAAFSLLEIRPVWLLHNQEVMITFHYDASAPVEDLFAWTDACLADFEAAVLPSLHNAMSNECADCLLFGQVQKPLRYRHRVRQPVVRNGQIEESSLPSAVSGVIRRQSTFAVRQDQGRVYLPGIPVTAESDSRLSVAYLGAHKAALENVISLTLEPLAGPQAYPVLLNAVEPRSQVYFAYLDPIIRYQRRREIGVGI